MKENLNKEVSDIFGSVENFEDHYEFAASMIFGSPWSFNNQVLDRLRAENEELTPDLLVNEDIFTNPRVPDLYRTISENIEFHKKRGRFCRRKISSILEIPPACPTADAQERPF